MCCGTSRAFPPYPTRRVTVCHRDLQILAHSFLEVPSYEKAPCLLTSAPTEVFEVFPPLRNSDYPATIRPSRRYQQHAFLSCYDLTHSASSKQEHSTHSLPPILLVLTHETCPNL